MECIIHRFQPVGERRPELCVLGNIVWACGIMGWGKNARWNKESLLSRLLKGGTFSFLTTVEFNWKHIGNVLIEHLSSGNQLN